VIDSWPPAMLSTVVRPAISVSVPPAPLLPLPTATAMAPAVPPVAAADPTDTEPVLPELDVPELKTSRPLVPTTPALAV
jgi:hypothetical protein